VVVQNDQAKKKITKPPSFND